VDEGEDPGYYAYPMYTTFLIAPLALLDYAWAEAVWLALLMACLISATVLLFDVVQWRPSPVMLGVTIFWALFFYPAARGVLLGQPGIAVYFLEVLTLWALMKGRYGLAGTALAISTIKPQMGFLLVPFLLLWGIRERRWRFVGWFSGVWGGLMLLSFLVLPSWFSEWAGQISRYTSYTAIGSPVWVLSRVYLRFLGPVGEGVITVLLVTLMMLAWWRVLAKRQPGLFGWTLMLTLVITHLVALRTATPHFVVFVIPMMFYFRQLVASDRRCGQRVVFATQLVLLVGLWALFLTTVEAKFEHPAMYLPLPFGILIVLLTSRTMWVRENPFAPAEVEVNHAA
jgi:hypothetical protein